MLLILILILLIPRVATSTQLNPLGLTECRFWGDPHVITFDGARPSFYGEGEFWVIKNPRVQIQGRYAGTKYTFGLASTQKVAIGGPFIGGNTIEIEPVEEEFGGSIRVNGRAVLQNFGTYEVGGARITYDSIGDLIDNAASRWEKKVVHLSLPEGIHMDVFRWGNYLDMRIQQTGPLEGGQDGSCGNRNGDANDDTTVSIFKRIGSRVTQDECLFSRHTPVRISRQMEEMMAQHCDAQTKSNARSICERDLRANPEENRIKSCIFDHCFGQNEHALQTAKNFATAAELKEANLQ